MAAMKTNVTILGSGTVVPSLARSSCSILVEHGPWKFLFDLGAGTMRRLLEAGVTINEISHLFFSHLHPDHTGEFVSFLFATKYPENRGRRTPFQVVGSRGFKSFYEKLQGVFGNWIVMDPGLLTIVELNRSGPDGLSIGPIEVRSLPVNHIEGSLGYRVQLPGGWSVVYSGDTDDCRNLVSLARHCDLFICECSLPDDMKIDGHLTPSLAGRIASEAGVKKLVLTHLYPECDRVDIQAQCRRIYPGPLVIARDLMRIEIP